MSAEFIVKRTLRDPEDGTGQSVRSWTVIAEGGRLEITGGIHEAAYSPISCLYEDAETLIADIRKAIESDAPSKGEP